jgi:hypothetical protein
MINALMIMKKQNIDVNEYIIVNCISFLLDLDLKKHFSSFDMYKNVTDCYNY